VVENRERRRSVGWMGTGKLARELKARGRALENGRDNWLMKEIGACVRVCLRVLEMVRGGKRTESFSENRDA
jgi:hypothetical protein